MIFGCVVQERWESILAGNLGMIQEQEAEKWFHPCIGSKAVTSTMLPPSRFHLQKVPQSFLTAPPNAEPVFKCVSLWGLFSFKPPQRNFHETIAKCHKSTERDTHTDSGNILNINQIRPEKTFPTVYCSSNTMYWTPSHNKDRPIRITIDF